MLVSLRKLLSACVYANLEACQIIRQYYYHESSKDIRYKEEGDSRSVVTKADIDAQCKIINILRNQEPWGPHLHIIGEEDEESSTTTTTTTNEHESISNILKQLSLQNEEDEIVPIDELCIFIDPLDGTREFVENRIQNVGCLIGITRNGKAIAGTVGVPFPSTSNNSSPPAFIRYAYLNDDVIAGTWPHDETHNVNDKDDDDDGFTIIYTGDSKNKILSNVVQLAKQIILQNNKNEVKHEIVGGTAAKLSLIATTKTTSSSMAILHVGTNVWDTVATEALVRSQGGHVTDFLGRPLETHLHPSKIRNVYGVIASSKNARTLHDELCQTIQQQADPTLLHQILNP